MTSTAFIMLMVGLWTPPALFVSLIFLVPVIACISVVLDCFCPQTPPEPPPDNGKV